MNIQQKRALKIKDLKKILRQTPHRQTPQIPQPCDKRALIDFDRQEEVKKEPIPRTLQAWEEELLRNAAKQNGRYCQSRDVQTQFAPEFERERGYGQGRNMGLNRDSFSPTLGARKEAFRDS